MTYLTDQAYAHYRTCMMGWSQRKTQEAREHMFAQKQMRQKVDPMWEKALNEHWSLLQMCPWMSYGGGQG